MSFGILSVLLSRHHLVVTPMETPGPPLGPHGQCRPQSRTHHPYRAVRTNNVCTVQSSLCPVYVCTCVLGAQGGSRWVAGSQWGRPRESGGCPKDTSGVGPGPPALGGAENGLQSGSLEGQKPDLFLAGGPGGPGVEGPSRGPPGPDDFRCP